jgi:hypothetical protein
MDVKEKKLSVAQAARRYSVPEQTLRDRILGHISAEAFKSGPQPVLDLEHEARLVQHIKQIAAVGYGYTRSELHLGLREKEHPLSLRWFYGFMGRRPELKVWRPKTISELRAKATSRQNIDSYFSELGRIMDKYGLTDKPQCIYNVDEKGIQQTFTPPKVVGDSKYVPYTVSSEKSATTTIIGCGNALGHQIPPYFIFKFQRHKNENRTYGRCLNWC